jgi:hypothetical protein
MRTLSLTEAESVSGAVPTPGEVASGAFAGAVAGALTGAKSGTVFGVVGGAVFGGAVGASIVLIRWRIGVGTLSHF